MNLKVANDNGNSEQDLIINGLLIQQPNVFAKVARVPNLDEVNIDYVLKNIHNNLIVAVEGGLYYVGEYALKSGQPCRTIDVGVDNNKVESSIVYINTLAHIAAAAVRETAAEGGSLDVVLKVNIDMATALPVSYYNKRNASFFADKFMEKKHFVTVQVGNKEVQVELIFDYVKVIPEGVTAAFAFKEYDKIFDEYNKNHKDDKIDKDFFNTAKVLHVAIGEGTTEFPVTNDVHFKPDFITGTNNGNGHAIDAVIEDFKKQYGLMKFTRQEYSNVLKDKGHKYHATAVEFIAPALEDQAEQILHMSEKVIQQANNDIDIVCVYGGGSIMMQEALENRLETFCKRAMIKLLYVPEEYAVTLEAVGLDAFLKSKIFESIKKSYTAKAKK
jgi:plasmid segregation protein ParM